MKISVIIAAYNATQTIAAQLDALYQQQCSDPFEIIVVNNASTDSTCEIVKQYQAKMPYLRLETASARQAPGYARNVGASVAQGKYLVFCDADDVVAPGWLAAMSEALSQSDFVAGRADYQKLNSSFRQYLEDLEGNGVHYGLFLPFAGTNNLGIKKLIHDMIGGFDESLRSLQDVDYCWRVQEVGFKLQEAPDAIVHFRFRSNLQENFKRWQRFGYYSVLLYRKHLPMGFPRWIVLKGLLAIAAIPVKFLLRVRDRESLEKWWLNCGWCWGYLLGWLKLGWVKPAPVIQPNPVRFAASSMARSQ